MIRAREIRSDDITDLMRLGRAMHAESPVYSPYSFEPAKLEYWFDLCLRAEDWLGVVAENDAGDLIGFCGACCADMLFSYEKSVEDLCFYVSPDWRGTTAAVRLLRFMESWAQARGARNLRIGITTGTNNEQAARFFARFGFERTGLLVERALS